MLEVVGLVADRVTYNSTSTDHYGYPVGSRLMPPLYRLYITHYLQRNMLRVVEVLLPAAVMVVLSTGRCLCDKFEYT